MNPEEVPVAGALPTSTSRLAVFSVLVALLCIPGVSGVGGVLLGLFALAQIRVSITLEGAGLAKLGILGGALNLALCLGVGMHYLAVRDQVDPAADRFFAAWGQSEQAGEDAAAPGLRVEMHKSGQGEVLWRQFKDRAGGLNGVGDRDHFGYSVDVHGGLHEKISATYPIRNARGLPFDAVVRFTPVEDQLQVVGFDLSSPILHGPVSLQGMITPDLGSYDGPSEHLHGHMKSFSK